MKNNIAKSLSKIGFSNYELTIDGKLYRISPSRQLILRDSANRFSLIDDCGIKRKRNLKYLYKNIYKKEFSFDKIISIKNEKWKPIDNTGGRYFISNCGRVKSLCGYNAIILQPYKNTNGYLTVKIQEKNRMIHQLVAIYFCENNYKNERTQIHHIDGNRQNNYYKNLEILTVAEHKKRHSKKETKESENVLSKL